MAYADLAAKANRLTAFTKRLHDRQAGGKETKREFVARAHLRAWIAEHKAWLANRKAAKAAQEEDKGKDVVEKRNGIITVHTRRLMRHESALAKVMGQQEAAMVTVKSQAAKRSGWSNWKQKNPGWRARYGGK